MNEERQALIKELEAKNEEARNFSYIISHELKAPLRGVSTVAEWLKSDYADQLGDQDNHKLELLTGRVKRVHDLIDAILRYSRIDTQEEKKSVVDVGALLAKVVDTLELPQNIEVKIENGFPKLWIAPLHLEQIFRNLVGNAIKFMDKPDGIITIGHAES